MPTFVADAIKAQLKTFLGDNDVQFDENAVRDVLAAKVEETLRTAGIDPTRFDLQTNRVLIPASEGRLPSMASSRAEVVDLPPPSPFALNPQASVASRWEKWVTSFTYYRKAAFGPTTSSEKLRNVFLHVAGPQVQELFASLQENDQEPDLLKRAAWAAWEALPNRCATGCRLTVLQLQGLSLGGPDGCGRRSTALPVHGCRPVRPPQ